MIEVIHTINKKSCDLDPISTALFQECVPELTPIIMYIVNMSLSLGIFPSQLKCACVRPIIKKLDSDSNDYRNYRPVSNLAFLSKILEKCVNVQLNQYLDENNMHAKHQSGYRKFHSCETATTKIFNDILCCIDSRSHLVLLLLDLSAAFDTINHDILLNKLKHLFGINKSVLKWFSSYLDERLFYVKINNSKSDKCFLRIGVPQSSILGPILFILYTKNLEIIARRYGFEIHLYADDTQLYIEFDPVTQSKWIEQNIKACLNEIQAWMISNFLKLNEDKTETVIIHPKSRQSASDSIISPSGTTNYNSLIV